MDNKPREQSTQAATPKWQISLRMAILLVFILLYIATFAAIYTIRTVAFTGEMKYTSQTMMHDASDAVYRELTAGIKPIEIEGKFTAKLIEHGVVSRNRDEMPPYLYYLVNTIPLVRSAFWGDENGNFIVARKEDDGAVSTEEIWMDSHKHEIQHYQNGNVLEHQVTSTDHFDPRHRSWYQAAVKEKNYVWTGLFNYAYAKEGITLSIPVYNKSGKLDGVLGFVVSLEYLDKFISNQVVARRGYSFIISQNEELIAYPNRDPFLKSNIKDNQIINVHNSSLSIIDKALHLYKATGKDEFEITANGKVYLISYVPILELGASEWLIGVVVPRSDFTGFLQDINYYSLLVGLTVILLGIVLLSTLANRVVKPINALIKETKKIKEFDLDDEINIHSHMREVNFLKNSLNSMRRGLKHFQKYVPKTLVHQLIESGQDTRVGGEKKNLVVLFSDIENFSSISETVDPQQLMVQVCEYFETITSVIIDERGTIDKYIGDSVMAFWGAPLVEEDPCLHAARAALRCQDRLKQLNEAWAERGWPVFVTRIGIHMGDAIVGNVGSSERLSYTALGDTINITSRLESINKNYHTKILVSNVVYQEIKNAFIFRQVDTVLLKGIGKPIDVYELLGDRRLKLTFNLAAYDIEFTKALDAMHAHDYKRALVHFNQCLTIYPADYLAPTFIKQCEAKLS